MTNTRNDTGDVLYIEAAEGADLELMSQGCHYDYKAQVWADGHDHAHCASDTAPLMFCGCDRMTCYGD